MSVSPADFYAYSRATGVQIPDDPYERAELVPEVRAFRQNQLRAPQQEQSKGPDPLSVGLGVGLALAGGLAGGLGIRKLLKGPAKSATAGVRQVNLGDMAGDIATASRFRPRAVNESVPTPSVAPTVATPKVDAQDFTPRGYLEKTGAVAPAEDLTSVQQQDLPQVIDQKINAVESAEDQVTGRMKTQLQRNEDLDMGQVEALEDSEPINRVAAQLPDGIPADQTKIKKPIITGNPWETEELLEEMGNANRAYQENIYEKGGRTAADLTGTLPLRSVEDAKKLRALKLSTNMDASNPAYQAALDSIQNSPPVRVRGNQVRLSEFSDSAGREGIGINRLSPQEILDRTMASVSYPREMRDQFLNPNIKTEELKKYLGTVPQERAGRVSINPTFEIAGGAAASMPGSPTYSQQTRGAGGVGLTNVADTSDWNQLKQLERLDEENLVRDPNTGNFIQMVDESDVDPTEVMTGGKYGGAEYGDTEGVGNLLIETEAFKEKTNQGTTMIPGATETMRGAASGSEREERFQDVVLPLRRNAEGLQTRGVVAAPSYEQEIKNINASFNAGNINAEEANLLKSKLNADANLSTYLTSLEVGKRQNKQVVSTDINTQGSKLVGGVQSEQPNISKYLTTQPVTEWRKNSGVIKGADGLLYSAPGKEIVGEAPLVGFRRSRIPNVKPDAPGGAFVDVPNAPLVNLTLSRSELQDIAENAKNTYFNNPKEKAAYLQRVDPELLTTGIKQGLTVSEIGEPYHYQNFITEKIDNYLMNNKGINLPILKQGDYGIDKAGTTFVMNLLKTEKTTPVYGKKFEVNKATGRQVPLRDETGKVVFNRGGYVTYATADEKTPIPGRYEVTGGGGIDPMTIGEDYTDKRNVAFYTPRVDTVSQRKVLDLAARKGVSASAITGTTNTQIGSLMSKLRREMETPGARNARISTGSSARTANPYTGAAAPASGPASRVLEGDYQYTPEQLEVKLPGRRVNENIPDTVDTYQAQNFDTIMNQLQAQAGRRRGKRNS